MKRKQKMAIYLLVIALVFLVYLTPERFEVSFGALMTLFIWCMERK
ncbi:MAG: hypothetical protein GF375_04345 [Candidatus Omnitrophica bacterium]|nr:hypothetical protein [Candidatus Omnitrophota bacterium]